MESIFPLSDHMVAHYIPSLTAGASSDILGIWGSCIVLHCLLGLYIFFVWRSNVTYPIEHRVLLSAFLLHVISVSGWSFSTRVEF